MIRLDLSYEEAALLRAILEGDLHRLTWEIARTDHRDFREHLRRRESLLSTVHDRLTAASRVVPLASPG